MTGSAWTDLAGALVDPALGEQLAGELKAVDAELQALVSSDVRLVSEVAGHTLKAGGKRLRPALVGLCAAATGLPFESSRARVLGATMELIHMATLMHDDVIDHAPVRRGVATASAIFGNTASILTGDVLLARAMAALAEDGDLRIIRNVSRAVVDLAEGEVAELEARGVFDLSRERHFDILRQKTATFIQSCCEVGGLVSGASEDVVEALGSYGFHLGMAFQIADDLLDYRGDDEKTGKKTAVDFREGCATLPLILLVPKLSDAELQVTRLRFGNGVDDEEVHMICGWMAARGVFAEAEAVAQEHIRAAQKALDVLPPSPQRTLLELVGEFVVRRQA